MNPADKERNELLAMATALGYAVVFQEFCEDALTPGFPGQIGGRCDHQRRVITVSTHRGFQRPRSKREMSAILAHEIEHAGGAAVGSDFPDFGLRCGSKHDDSVLAQGRDIP